MLKRNPRPKAEGFSDKNSQPIYFPKSVLLITATTSITSLILFPALTAHLLPMLVRNVTVLRKSYETVYIFCESFSL
jgi:hypothetical protein